MTSEQAFQDILDDHFNEYVRLSSAIGDLVKVQSAMVQAGVTSLQRLIQLATTHQRPSDSQIQSLIKPLAQSIEQVQQFREKNRTSVYFNHLSTISESIPAFGWVVVQPTPAPYVKEMADSGQFYSNKVLVAYKEKDRTHVEWANAWTAFLVALQKYIRQHHTTGLVWNARGQPLPAGTALNGSGAVAGGRGAPPPPPPPPPMIPPVVSAFAATDLADERLALMRELNIGTDITKGLRKVRSDQQTHKNPELRSAPPAVPPKPTGPTYGRPAAATAAVQHPPKLALEGRKWLVEYQQSQPQLEVRVNEMSESVHLYRCRDTVVLIKGKANSVIVDSCIKTGVVFEDIVSSVEFVNCQNVQAQVRKVVVVCP